MFTKVQRSNGCFTISLLAVIMAGLCFLPTVHAQNDDLTARDAGKNPLKGETKVPDYSQLIEVRLSAYKAVACSANVINRDLTRFRNSIDTLMIYDTDFVDTLSAYSVMMKRFNDLDKNYMTAFNQIPLAIRSVEGDKRRPIEDLLNPFTQIRNLATDTLALFRTNTLVKGIEIARDRDAFISKAVNNLNIDVYYPNRAVPIIFPATDQTEGSGSSSPLLDLMTKLSIHRLQSLQVMRELPETSPSYARLELLNELYDRSLADLGIDDPPETIGDKTDKRKSTGTKRRKDTSYKTLVDFLQAEIAFKKLQAAQNKSRVYWLDVDISAIGANVRKKNNLIFDVFTGGNRLSFSAGAVVSYRIFNSDGDILVADTVMTYMPYKKSGKITGFICRPTQTNIVP